MKPPSFLLSHVFQLGRAKRKQCHWAADRASQMGRRESIWWRASAWFCVFSKGSWQNKRRSKLSRWLEASTFAIRLFRFCQPSYQFQLLSPYRQGLVHDYYQLYHLNKVGYFVNTDCLLVNSVRQYRSLQELYEKLDLNQCFQLVEMTLNRIEQSFLCTFSPIAFKILIPLVILCGLTIGM